MRGFFSPRYFHPANGDNFVLCVLVCFVLSFDEDARAPITTPDATIRSAGLSNRTISKGNQNVLTQSYSGSTLSAAGPSGKSPDACYSLHEVWGPSYVEHSHYLRTTWNICDKSSKKIRLGQNISLPKRELDIDSFSNQTKYSLLENSCFSSLPGSQSNISAEY